jgi:hypothetical protein
MLAGVSQAIHTVIQAIESSDKYANYLAKDVSASEEVSRRGRLEGLKLVWDMITDWSFGAYPQSPEAIERKRRCMHDEELIPPSTGEEKSLFEQLDIIIEEPVIIADIRPLMEFQRYSDDEMAAAAGGFDPATAEEAYRAFIDYATRIKRGDISDEERGWIAGANEYFFDVADSTSDALSKNPINKYLMLTMGELSKYTNTPPEEGGNRF